MNCIRRLVFACLFLIVFQVASAQDYRFGLGIRLSNATPTLNHSITGKYFITQRGAIEGLVTVGNRFGFGALLEIYRPLDVPGLSWFYGGGAYVGIRDNNTYFGPTGIVGLDYKFPDAPVNVSLDWKPELDILPAINFVPDAFAVSLRFALK